MIDKAITNYNKAQLSPSLEICNFLANFIVENLKSSSNKLWHGGPVWFIDGNPVVGYWVRKHGVTLLFWSGQSFDEPKLNSSGKFKATEINYTDIVQIDQQDLIRWLEKAHDIQWDYKNIVKQKGKLKRLK